MDNGYWTKFEVREVKPSEHQPHGIKYSLTLHNKDNKRVLGYDNAHAVKPRRKNYSGNISTWDHKHKMDIVIAYEFQGPGKLVEDFWADVNKLLNGE